MSRPTRVRYYTLAWLVGAAGLAYLCRNSVGVVESTIRKDLGLSLTESGMFLGAFFWSYAICQIPCGSLAQRYGSRIALTGFAVLWSVGTLAIGLSTTFWILIFAQLAMGAAQGGLFPGSVNSIGNWLPTKQRAIACGLLAAGMQVGAIVASFSTGAIAGQTGWRMVFMLFALPSLVWAYFFYLCFRDTPEETNFVNAEEKSLIREGSKTEFKSEESAVSSTVVGGQDLKAIELWTTILSRPAVWLLCSQQICRAAGYMFFASWFPTFLQKTRGVDVSDSGSLQGLVLTGTLLGGVLGGWLADIIWRKTKSLRLSRSGFSGGSLAICGILILLAWFVTSLPLAITLLALGNFFAAIAGPGAFSATIDMGGKNVPQIFGLMNMMGNFAAASCPIIVGWIFQSTENWNLILVLFAIVYILGALSWFFVDPSQSIFQPEKPIATDSLDANSKPKNT